MARWLSDKMPGFRGARGQLSLSRKLGAIIKPLVDPKVGVITPFAASNLLVVTDWRSNLNRIDELVRNNFV